MKWNAWNCETSHTSRRESALVSHSMFFNVSCRSKLTADLHVWQVAILFYVSLSVKYKYYFFHTHQNREDYWSSTTSQRFFFGVSGNTHQFHWLSDIYIYFIQSGTVWVNGISMLIMQSLSWTQPNPKNYKSVLNSKKLIFFDCCSSISMYFHSIRFSIEFVGPFGVQPDLFSL